MKFKYNIFTSNDDRFLELLKEYNFPILKKNNKRFDKYYELMINKLQLDRIKNNVSIDSIRISSKTIHPIYSSYPIIKSSPGHLKTLVHY